MMSSKQFVVMIVCASAMGCQVPADGAESVSVEPNALGVTQVEIRRDVQSGDRVLTIRGLDDGDRELGLVTLRTGTVLYTSEPDLIPAAPSAGTELTAQVGQDSFTSITPDRDPHETALPTPVALATFVRLSAVAAAIQDEAGIRFPSATTEGEVAFAASTCTASRFPSTAPGGVGSPLQCCQDGNSTWHKINGGTNANLLGYRIYGNTCRTSSGATGCSLGGTGVCSFGPCASQNQTVSNNTTAAAVFIPTSAPTQCGADSNGSAAGGVVSGPEAYTGSQSLYAGVTASCPYQGCLFTGVPFQLAPSTNPHSFAVTMTNAGGSGIVYGDGGGDPLLGGPLSSGTYASAFADGTGSCVTIQPGSASQAFYSGVCNGQTGINQHFDCCFSNIKSNLTLTILWEN